MSNGLINRQYVGARYVPKIMGEWNKALRYEALSIVTYMGNSFTSKVPVPANVDITNEDYWINTGNYNAQVEEYRKEVIKLKQGITCITPEMYGAIGDGITNDTLSFNNAINALKQNDCLALTSGKTYLVDNLNLDTVNTITINGNGAVLLCNNENGFNIRCGQESKIFNVIFDGNNKALTTLTSRCADTFFDACVFKNGVTNNLILESQYYGQKIINCIIGNNLSYVQNNIIINASDCSIINLTCINALNKAVQIIGNETYALNIHAWCNKKITGGEICFEIVGSFRGSQLYSDSYQKAFSFLNDLRTIIMSECVTAFYSIDDSCETYALYLNGDSTLRNVTITNSYFNSYSDVKDKCNFTNVRLYNLRYNRNNNTYSHNFKDINDIFNHNIITPASANINLSSVNYRINEDTLHIVGVVRNNGTKFSTSQSVMKLNTSALQIYGDQYFTDVFGSDISAYAYLTEDGVIGLYQSTESNTFTINLIIPLREKYALR
jgi:hypothetical protein